MKKGHAHVLGDRDTWAAAAAAAEGKSAEFALATDRFLAPLICRVVRAVRVLGAGLGFPVGASAPLRFSPPTSDISIGDPLFINRVNLVCLLYLAYLLYTTTFWRSIAICAYHNNVERSRAICAYYNNV